MQNAAGWVQPPNGRFNSFPFQRFSFYDIATMRDRLIIYLNKLVQCAIRSSIVNH